MQHELDLRRACPLMRAARSGLHPELRMTVKDAPVIEAMMDLSSQLPHFAARRNDTFLAHGIEISKDHCSQIESAAGVQVQPRNRRNRGVTRTSSSFALHPQAVCFRSAATLICKSCSRYQALREFLVGCPQLVMGGTKTLFELYGNLGG